MYLFTVPSLARVFGKLVIFDGENDRNLVGERVEEDDE